MSLTDYLHSPDAWLTFLTLSLLEIVLGIDNVIFLALVVNRLDRRLQGPARFTGLLLALMMRVAFLVSVVWLVGLDKPLFELGQAFPQLEPAWLRNFAVSWRDLILLAGGSFLVFKAVTEIGAEILPTGQERTVHGASAFGLVILQIVALDLVFSIDSVMTAVGLSKDLPIMIAAITLSILVMLLASGPVSRFIERHPTIKMLALTFLIAVGAHLISHGLHYGVPRYVLYVLIGFSLFVELFKLLAGRRTQDLAERLRHPLARIAGVLLLVAFGVLVAQNLRYIAHETYLAIVVTTLAFQLVLEVLNALARRKRRRSLSEADAP